MVIDKFEIYTCSTILSKLTFNYNDLIFIFIKRIWKRKLLKIEYLSKYYYLQSINGWMTQYSFINSLSIDWFNTSSSWFIYENLSVIK